MSGLWITTRGALSTFTKAMSTGASVVNGLHPGLVDEQVAHEAMGTGTGVNGKKFDKGFHAG